MSKIDLKKIAEAELREEKRKLDKHMTKFANTKGKSLFVDKAKTDFYGEYESPHGDTFYKRQNKLSNKAFIELTNQHENGFDISYRQYIGYQNAPESASPKNSDGRVITTDELLERIENGQVWGAYDTNRPSSTFFDDAWEEMKVLLDEEVKKFVK